MKRHSCCWGPSPGGLWSRDPQEEGRCQCKVSSCHLSLRGREAASKLGFSTSPFPGRWVKSIYYVHEFPTATSPNSVCVVRTILIGAMSTMIPTPSSISTLGTESRGAASLKVYHRTASHSIKKAVCDLYPYNVILAVLNSLGQMCYLRQDFRYLSSIYH